VDKRYTAALDERATKTVWPAVDTGVGTGTPQGCLTLLWPGTAEEYSSKCSRFNPVAFHLENPKTAPIHTLVLPRGPPTCG